jgi:hypothetical protein
LIIIRMILAALEAFSGSSSCLALPRFDLDQLAGAFALLVLQGNHVLHQERGRNLSSVLPEAFGWSRGTGGRVIFPVNRDEGLRSFRVQLVTQRSELRRSNAA